MTDLDLPVRRPITREPTHPGELMREILLDHVKLSISEAARRMNISRPALHDVLRGSASLTPEMALRFARLVGGEPSLFVQMQSERDLRLAERRLKETLDHIEPAAGGDDILLGRKAGPLRGEVSAARAFTPMAHYLPAFIPDDLRVARTAGLRRMPALMMPPHASTTPASSEDALAVAREELVARLSAGIRPERLALLSRSDLAKLVSGAVQAYFVRHAIKSNPLARRDLITDVMLALINSQGPGRAAAASAEGTAGVRQLPSRKAAVEAAKAQIQPLILEYLDVAAAAEMPRAAFEAQLTGWVKELLAETKIQLNFVEQRELVDSLITDMGLGSLEPLIADETVTDAMLALITSPELGVSELAPKSAPKTGTPRKAGKPTLRAAVATVQRALAGRSRAEVRRFLMEKFGLGMRAAARRPMSRTSKRGTRRFRSASKPRH